MQLGYVPGMRPLFALALALVFAAGCGADDDDDGAAGAPLFEGVPWTLTSGVDVEGWEAHAPSATFVEGTVSGSTGCNRFTAPYTIDGDTLAIGAAARTEMACPAPADAVESAFANALEQVAGWRMEGAELVLAGEDEGELLRFGEPSPDGAWEATAFLIGDGVSSPLPGTEVTAVFEDGTLSGSAGCNTYRATYETGRGTITIGEPSATMMACAEPAGAMDQEQAYLSALPLAVGYRVEGTQLSLLTADGTFVATYQRKP